MYFPLQLRLPIFYTIVLGTALCFFGIVVYNQAEQRAYKELDNSLSSRAASVLLGKDIVTGLPNNPITFPTQLPSVDGLGTGGVAIEVLDNNLMLLATTSNTKTDLSQTTVTNLNTSPVPWDAHAARWILQHPQANDGAANSLYSTITYLDQHIRVYTTSNTTFGTGHIIQTARSEQDIEQSLSNLRAVLLQGGMLALAFAFVGGWLTTWSVLAIARRMTRTAHSISAAQDFSQRVPDTTLLGRNELSLLATTFNTMLTNLQESYQRQQRFVADASHELRAPITSMRCNLELLTRAPDLPAEEAQAALADAQAEADRMGRLVNDLLTLARSDASEQSRFIGYKKYYAPKQLIDLDSLLLEVFRQYRPATTGSEGAGKRQGPRLLLQAITPVQVQGNADQLKQVLVALLDNALKYTPFEGSVSLSLSTSGQDAVVKVSDTGIGILSEDLPHIFERFYRADRTRSRDRGGSGLGLTIAQSIVQEHQGSIEVESTPGKGSTFTIRLPCLPRLDTQK